MPARKPLAPLPAVDTPFLLHVYARNLEHQAFKRGWSSALVAQKLGVTMNTYNRIRFAQGRYIDPEVFEACLKLFECSPNDLLIPQPDIEYK